MDLPSFLWSKISGLSREVSVCTFRRITEKGKLCCRDIKHSMGSAPYIETRKRKALSSGVSNIYWLFAMTYSNMQNSMVVFTFSVTYWKYHFWENFVQKIKVVSLKLKFGAKTNSNLQILMFMLTFFRFLLEILFLGKVSSRDQSCQFELKGDT